MMVYCLVFRCGNAECGIKRKLRVDILFLNAEKSPTYRRLQAENQ